MTLDWSSVIRQCNIITSEQWRSASDDFPSFLAEYSGEDRLRNEEWVGEAVQRMQSRMDCFPKRLRLPFRVARWRRKTEAALQSLLLTEPVLNLRDALPGSAMDAFQEEIKSFLRMARDFDPSLESGDLGQALRNYLVYAVFREMNGLPQLCTPAIFGYSMLYPYTDNYIDAPVRTREERAGYNALIRDKLSGVPVSPESPHAQKTVELLERIESVCPRDKGRDAFEGLLLMLEAQRDSLRQQERGECLGEEEVFSISMRKGGLSVLLDRFFVDKEAPADDLAFYYGFGLLLQFCDDLQDIAEDKGKGSMTIFTMQQSPEGVREVINRMFHFTEKLFSLCARVPSSLRDFLVKSCHLLILTSALGSGEYLSPAFREALEAHLPVSPAFLEEIRSLPVVSGEESRPDLLALMDVFLLR